MQTIVARLVPILLGLGLCFTARADIVDNLVQAVLSGDEAKAQKAHEKLISEQKFPSALVAASLTKTYAAFRAEKDEKRKKQLDAALMMLADIAGQRGDFSLVSPLITLVGESDLVTQHAELALGRLTCHGIGETPKAGRERHKIWLTWWNSMKNKPGVKGASPDRSPFVPDQLKLHGIELPPPHLFKPAQMEQVFSALFRGMRSDKSYVRYWSAKMSFGLLGKGFEFDENAKPDQRSKVIAQMEQHYQSKKAEIRKRLEDGLKHRPK